VIGNSCGFDDTVNYDLLVETLNSYSIRGVALHG
jgi:hypothetical protein